MDPTIVRHNIMPGKDDDSLNPCLRKPLRNYEDVTREQTDRSDPSKNSTDSSSKRGDRT